MIAERNIKLQTYYPQIPIVIIEDNMSHMDQYKTRTSSKSELNWKINYEITMLTQLVITNICVDEDERHYYDIRHTIYH